MRNQLFIGGEFVDAVDGGTIEVINPHDCSVITEIAEGRAADIDRAVDAAAAPFRLAVDGRRRTGRLLLKLADAIEAMAKNWPNWKASTPVTRSAMPASSTCPAPRRASATSVAWPTSCRATSSPSSPGS